jgi:hypothetical protein
MHIEVRTDRHVHADAHLLQQVSKEVGTLLARFADQLTRVEVHLGDVNADKGGSTDRRCMMEARLAGQAPVAVTHHASTLAEAYRGGARQLQRLLGTRLARVGSRRGRESIRHRQSTDPPAPG